MVVGIRGRKKANALTRGCDMYTIVPKVAVMPRADALWHPGCNGKPLALGNPAKRWPNFYPLACASQIS